MEHLSLDLEGRRHLNYEKVTNVVDSMFGLFKRTKIERWEMDLLETVLVMLPIAYASLTNQIKDGLFRGVFVGASYISGYVAFTFNSGVINKYEKGSGKDYKITGIKVYDKKKLRFLPYEIYISRGAICGYSLGEGKNSKIDFSNIDISGFRTEFIGGSDDLRILDLLNDEEKRIINPADVYSVIVNNKEYFHICDLEDGDFIGIDHEKSVYKITHDPLEVVLLDKKIVDVLKSNE